MPIDVREISADDFDKLLSLLKAGGEQSITDREALTRFMHPELGLSLLASENGAPAGAVICGRRDGGIVLRLLIADGRKRDDLGRLLIDKALGKLASRGLHTCHIRLEGEDDGRSLWDAVSWNRKLESAARSSEAA